MTITAASISGRLKRAGFHPLPSGTSRNREGIRVSRAALPGAVTVRVDLDSDSAAEKLAAELEQSLTASGLFLVLRTDARMTVVSL